MLNFVLVFKRNYDLLVLNNAYMIHFLFLRL